MPDYLVLWPATWSMDTLDRRVHTWALNVQAGMDPAEVATALGGYLIKGGK